MAFWIIEIVSPPFPVLFRENPTRSASEKVCSGNTCSLSQGGTLVCWGQLDFVCHQFAHDPQMDYLPKYVEQMSKYGRRFLDNCCLRVLSLAHLNVSPRANKPAAKRIKPLDTTRCQFKQSNVLSWLICIVDFASKLRKLICWPVQPDNEMGIE